jgi:predicted phage-related endonuclease
MGPHPYTTPTSIYDRLTTPAWGGVEQTEAMRLGMFFEQRIAQYAAQKLNLKLRANSRTIEHPKISLCATPDYYVLGHPILVEVKLSSKLYVWTDETLQPYIEWQARAQMAVTDRLVCCIAALVGSQFHMVMVSRDYKKEEALLQKVDTFWHENVMAGVRPMTLQQTSIIARIEA